MQKEFNEIFSELLKNFKALNRRVNNFETWEPSTGFTDTSAHAYLSSNQSILSGAFRQILFNAELWDTDNIHAGSVFTIPEDGKYLFNTVLWSSGITGTAYIRIYKSATANTFIDFNGTFQGMQISCIMDCVAGDTIQVDVFSTVNMTISGDASNPYQSFFQVQRIG